MGTSTSTDSDAKTPEQTGADGGHQRAENLSPERRHEIAVDAANARWGVGGQEAEKADAPEAPPAK